MQGRQSLRSESLSPSFCGQRELIQFAAGIPPVSLEQIKKSDPLVLAGVGHPASALGHVNAETAASVRNVIGRRK